MWRTQEDFLEVAWLLLLARKHGLEHSLHDAPAEGEELWGQLPLEVIVQIFDWLPRTWPPSFHWCHPVIFMNSAAAHAQQSLVTTGTAWCSGYVRLPCWRSSFNKAKTLIYILNNMVQLNVATREPLRRKQVNFVEVLVEQARGCSLTFGIAELEATQSRVPIGYGWPATTLPRARLLTDPATPCSGRGVKWKSWGWASRGMLYLNQPGRLERGPESPTEGVFTQVHDMSCCCWGRRSHASNTGTTWVYKEGDRVGIYVDLSQGKLAFFLNGRQIAPTFTDAELTSSPEPLYPTVVRNELFVFVWPRLPLTRIRL